MYSNYKELENTPGTLLLLILPSSSSVIWSCHIYQRLFFLFFFKLKPTEQSWRVTIHMLLRYMNSSSGLFSDLEYQLLVKLVPSFLFHVLVLSLTFFIVTSYGHPSSQPLLSTNNTPRLICYNGFQLFSIYRNISQWRCRSNRMSFSITTTGCFCRFLEQSTEN